METTDATANAYDLALTLSDTDVVDLTGRIEAAA
jgi:hypothetical protein